MVGKVRGGPGGESLEAPALLSALCSLRGQLSSQHISPSNLVRPSSPFALPPALPWSPGSIKPRHVIKFEPNGNIKLALIDRWMTLSYSAWKSEEEAFSTGGSLHTMNEKDEK